MKILIIEDEYNLADAIASTLKTQGYIVDIVTDGEDGLEIALTGTYDFIILDIMLPHKDGFTILKELKKVNSKAKVLVLTAKNTIEDKMNGFNNGADDYLTKPFHMDELIARVNVKLRKNEQDRDTIIVGDLLLKISKRKLLNQNNHFHVDIIGKEFQLLELLMQNQNQIIPKEQIFNKIWGYDSECEMNTLEAYISFLRKKMKLIQSTTQLKAIRGVGYKLEVLDEKIES